MADKRLMEPVIYHEGVETIQVLQIAQEELFSPEERKLRERNLTSADEFHRLYEEWLPMRGFERFVLALSRRSSDPVVRLHGRCALCDLEQDFVLRTDAGEINWQEQLVCPSCHANARMRFWICTVRQNAGSGKSLILDRGMSDWNRFRHFLGDSCDLCHTLTDGQNDLAHGTVNAENLPYETGSLQLIASWDFLETAETPSLVLQETARVLRPGGKFLFHTLFDANNPQTLSRAVRKNGEILYREKPLYRAPDRDQHSPAWNTFGWDVLELLRKCGFREAYGKAYYSIINGYMGYLPMYFEAIR